MFKVGFLINGKSTAKEKFYKELKNVPGNVSYVVEESTQPRAAEGLVRSLLNQQCTHLVGVGGDGTLHELVNAVINLNETSTLHLLPYGTANDFSKTLASAPDIRSLVAMIEKGNTQRVDVGAMQGKDYLQYFINIADFGIGADVVKKVDRSPKLFGAGTAFTSAILKSFLTYKNQVIKCTTPEWEWEGPIKSLVIANGRYFGSGLAIAPDARVDDGLFDIVITGDVTLWDYVKNSSIVKKGLKVNHPKVFYKSARELSITSQDGADLEADGEYIGQTPTTIKVLPGRINYLCS